MAKSSMGELKELAQKYSLQGKRLQAAETYQKLAQEDPSNPRWPQKAGEEFRTVGLTARAIAAFFVAAKIYAREGFTLKAITLCKLVLDLDKTNQAAQQMLAGFSAQAAPSPAPAVAPAPAPKPGPDHTGMIEILDIPAPLHQAPATPRRVDLGQAHDLPELLEVPDLPEVTVPPAPELPDIFGAPSAPGQTEAPALLEAPAQAEVPAPELPDIFGAPEVPQPPAEPEITEPVEPPAAPELPDIFGAPVLPESPEPPVEYASEGFAVSGEPALEAAPVEPSSEAAALDMFAQPDAPASTETSDSRLLGVSDIFGGDEPPAADAGAGGGGQAGFAVQPGDTLLASDLSRKLAPTLSAEKFDVDAFEIVIDEPEKPTETTEVPAPGTPSAAEKDEILTRMPPVPIFSSLGPAALRALLERVAVLDFAPGARLITQGEAGNSLYVLVDGEVAVFREGPPRVELTRLKEGAFFGEIALVTRAPRTASVEAVRECQVLQIPREVFNELISSYPDMVKVVLRFLRERLVNALVETHPLFAPFAGAERASLIRRFSLVEAPAGCTLVQEGAHANGLYIILCGDAEARRAGELQASLSNGNLFGVESLLTAQPSLVTVRTLTRSWILKMREDVFREVILTFSPVLSTLSEMIDNQSGSKAEPAAGGGLFEQLGIPLY